MSCPALFLYVVKVCFEQFQGTVRIPRYASRPIWLQSKMMWQRNNCQKQNACVNLKMHKLTPKYIYFCFRKNILIKKCMGTYSFFMQNNKFLKATPRVIYANSRFIAVLSSYLLLFFFPFSSSTLCSLSQGPVQLIYLCSLPATFTVLLK